MKRGGRAKERERENNNEGFTGLNGKASKVHFMTSYFLEVVGGTELKNTQHGNKRGREEWEKGSKGLCKAMSFVIQPCLSCVLKKGAEPKPSVWIIINLLVPKVTAEI